MATKRRYKGIGSQLVPTTARETDMLMALLFCEDNRIAAAAPACDQTPYGDAYWTEIYGQEIEPGSMFETAYATVANPELRERLLMLGIDETIDGRDLAVELEQSYKPPYVQRAA